jgi:hypothetical protein
MAYQDKQQFTGQSRNGRSSNQGHDQLYPSSYAIFCHFKSMRDAWAACGVETDQADRPWTGDEEWFITESVGLIPRDEVSRFLGRTGPAIKRRLYELGVSCYNRWGWTLHHTERVTGIGQRVVKKYLEEGRMPYLRGNKCLYIDPGDLLVVEEYDWSRSDIPVEAASAIRASLMKRMCFALLRFDWRSHSPFKIQKTCERYIGRIKNRRLLNYVPERPESLKGFSPLDWVRVRSASNDQEYLVDGVGRISSIYYSPFKSSCKGTDTACWMARIEFKQKFLLPHAQTGKQYRPRFHYTVRLDQLEKAEAPTTPRELSKEPWPVYAREVKNPRRIARARERGRTLVG